MWLNEKKYSFKNITPEDLLNFISDNIQNKENVYIRGFHSYVDNDFKQVYTPNIQREWQYNDMTDEE